MKRAASPSESGVAEPAKKPRLSVPRYLQKSGLDAGALQQLVDWLASEKLCIAQTKDLVADDHIEENHAVHPVLAVGYKGYEEHIYCNGCVDHCECCGHACDHLYDTRFDDPHESICHHCLESGRCRHPLPYTCPCCNEGRRELVYHEDRKGTHKQCCLMCEDDDCEHQ
jgi:hypothetical protein